MNAQWEGTNPVYFNAGNVGIGTDSPLNILDVNGSARFRRLGSTTAGATLGGDALSLQGWGANNPYIQWRNSDGVRQGYMGWNTNRLSLVMENGYNFTVENGNVGIGTTTPNEKLTVQGNIQIPLASSLGFIQSNDKFSHNGNFIGNYSLGWSNDSWQSGAPTAYFSGFAGIKFFTQSSARMAITYDGNVGIGTTTPNAKLDVGSEISNGSLGTVFGRLPEGNSSGAGTFLGVRGYGTQPINVKSFALEHSFYGSINSSINFHRGGGIT